MKPTPQQTPPWHGLVREQSLRLQQRPVPAIPLGQKEPPVFSPQTMSGPAFGNRP